MSTVYTHVTPFTYAIIDDWLTRTKIIDFVSREEILVSLAESYILKVNAFKTHKEGGVHPEAKQPLDPKGHSRTPWLSLEGGLLSGMDVKSTNIEDDEVQTNM